MNWNREKIEKIIIVSMLTVFMGQIYLSPGTSWFRLSMAVVTLSMLLLYFRQVPVTVVSVIVAVAIPLFRAFVQYISYREAPFPEIFMNYMPVAIFYLLFGLLFELLQVREKADNPLLFMISLWFCDSVSNVFEISYRSLVSSFDFDMAIYKIIVMGFMRSVITYSFYTASIYYKNRYDRKQKEERYREMLLFISSLKSELFFLRKSMVDIEDTMQRSYGLYRELEDTSHKDRALTVAKNIHEIKKDYYRVVDGMEKVLSEENKSSQMRISEIFDIMKNNTQKLVALKGKDIDVEFEYFEDFGTNEFYPIISVINNLISNAIDAIDSKGTIRVSECSDSKNFIFRVEDDGCGIDEDNMDVLFEPGFSTKYDPATGKMSTGIGLSHVREIVKKHLGGQVSFVRREGSESTLFEVRLPRRVADTKEGFQLEY
ncbi:two-component system, sensor histidine kinase YcbA [Peptoclostridium litorale DSM 5388]|uniref:histidine kinase n=1 Tax=Peptoclostridium litorale DSM 5388 TaxID=1121324 RepID=A0A069RG49_PEPLI|nr:ATP-binding protein [Peptoclostridium litorale]KDR95788.1 sensor histidine kinase GlnK [Peptoclostridium litorale DSM 5388]SIO21312.1 two-component system, sensor histidine kinase YcbA [Peptoclostridium litorale DSM 5388]